MKKRIFIIHGWGGSPNEGWLPWLKSELEKDNFEVMVPSMPNTDEPRIEEWVPYLSKITGSIDENTFFVGHSIGCQTILRYLEQLPADERIGGAVFIAGWFSLQNLESDEEREIAKPWIGTKIDFNEVKNKLGKSLAIFSSNDPYVPVENKEIFGKELNSEILELPNKGHFTGEDGVQELPEVLDFILKTAE
jgi:uncharacterized protein